MLILSRKSEEEIVIYNSENDEVLATLKVLDIQYGGDRVRLGFEAPDHIVIDRFEVYESKHNSGNNGAKPKVAKAARPPRRPPARKPYRED